MMNEVSDTDAYYGEDFNAADKDFDLSFLDDKDSEE
jgi:hypothetical protein